MPPCDLGIRKWRKISLHTRCAYTTKRLSARGPVPLWWAALEILGAWLIYLVIPPPEWYEWVLFVCVWFLATGHTYRLIERFRRKR